MVRVFVEGSDDEKFIIKILQDLIKNKELELSKKINFKSYINILGSKTKLLDFTQSKYGQVTSEIELGEVQKALFIFDCDFEIDDKNCNGMDKSKKCFDLLKKNLQWNIEIDVYIFNKNLDYFLMETIKDKDCYDDFQKLINCLDVEKLKPNKKPIANLYRDLYPYPQFDFKDDRFRPLKDKLIDLFKGIE
jgi:hypothetical protein